MADDGFAFPKFDLPALKGVAPEALVTTQRRNVEAMTSASQILADGVRTLGQRQAEIMQARMSDFAKKSETMLKVDGGKPNVTAGIEAMKEAYEQAIADSRELVEIMTKAQTDAFQVMNRCVIANLEDMKGLTR